MTDQASPTPEITPAPARAKRGWKTPLLVAGALAVGLSGAVATTAWSDGGRFGHGMWRQGGHWGDARSIDPASLDKMIERGVKHLAIELDATPEQQTRLVEIAQSAATDLRPLRDQLSEARKKGRDLLVQPNLDRAQIESFRAEQMALVDRISQRVAQAIGDAAEVLTPEQRAELGSRIERFGDFRRVFHRGWRRG